MAPVRTRAEVKPVVARHYDLFMDVISLEYYPYLIKRVVDKMNIQPGESILDLSWGQAEMTIS